MKATILAAALLLVASLARVDTQSTGTAAGRALPGSPGGPDKARPTSAVPTETKAVIDRYCATCHNQRTRAGGLALDVLDVAAAGREPGTWEKVVRKVRTGMMPPSGAPRPDRAALDRFAASLEESIDKVAAAAPNPGAPALHRLNRAEYGNAVRDLLDLPINAAALLPGDDSGEGFDNMASVLSVSPALMQAYVTAAAQISRLAVGDPTISAGVTTYFPPRGMSQAGHREGMPLGTRGGLVVQHVFPLDAEYEFSIGRAGGGLFGLAAGRQRRPGRDHAERRTGATDRTRRAAGQPAAEDSRRAPDHRRRHRPALERARRGRSVCRAGEYRRCQQPRHQRAAQPDRSWRHAEPAQDLHVQPPDAASRRTACARQDPLGAGDSRVPPAGRREGRRCRHVDRVLRVGSRAPRVRRRNSVHARPRARRSAVHLPLRARARWTRRRAQPIASAISSSRRGFRSSSGAAFPTRSCCAWRRLAGCASPPCSSSRRAGMLADSRAAR